MGNHKKKVLIVGQIPPPYGGQAIRIKQTIDHKYKTLEIYHVNLNFSQNMAGVGKVNPLKILHLFMTILRILKIRFSKGVKNIYYPPAGPNTIPIIRDTIILTLVRPFFKKTIFHFRASGISEKLKNNNLLYFFTYAAYFRPDISLQLSQHAPPDGTFLKSKHTQILNNGQPNLNPKNRKPNQKTDKIKILYVGVIKESKGIFDLLDAFQLLLTKNKNLLLRIMGEPDHINTKNRLIKQAKGLGLLNNIEFLGVIPGTDRFEFYLDSNIFVFPSFFESEAMPNVVIEAMQFYLPVVATKWRGAKELVVDKQTGFLVPINSPSKIFEKVQELIDKPTLRASMGLEGRKHFLENYQEQKYFENFEKIIFNNTI